MVDSYEVLVRVYRTCIIPLSLDQQTSFMPYAPREGRLPNNLAVLLSVFLYAQNGVNKFVIRT